MMPWRKRLLVAAAVSAAAALVAAAVTAILLGHTGGGATALVATFVATAFLLHAYWVRFDPFGESMRAGRGDSGQVALTFDDGPGPDTPAVLEALDEVGVRATFFMLGAAAAASPALVREVARRGHVVALHGYSHAKLHLASPGIIHRELDLCLEAIRGAGVEPAPLFRAPHGFKGPVLGHILRRRGFALVGWTRGVWDTERPGVDAIVDRASRRMRGGEILLLHDGCGTRSARVASSREQTAKAIPHIVRRWHAAGYRFVTVPELRAARRRDVQHVKPQSVTPDAVPGRMLPERVARVLRWLGIAALVAFAVVAARKLDPDEILRSLADANPAFLIAAAAANLLTLTMQTGRWLAIVHPVEPRAKARDAFFSLVAGYAVGILVPARASDLARAHLMAKRSGCSMATLTATAAVDHLLGCVALLAVLGAFTAASPLPVWLRSAGTVASAVAVAALAAVWLLRPRYRRQETGRGLVAVIARVRQGLLAVGRPRALALSSFFAVAGWTSEILIAHLSLRAFGLPAGAAPSLLCVVATTLSAAASVSPGNAGAFEIACILALSGFGVTREPAFAFAIGYHAVHLVPTALVGGGWLLVNGYRSAVLRGVP